MAVANFIRLSTVLKDNILFVQNLNNHFFQCGCIIVSRNFGRYTRTPKKFLEITKKDRNKVQRDDVFFIFDQVLPKYTLQEAIDTFKAYDLFGGEKIDILLKVDLNTGKNKIGVLKGIIRLPKPVSPSQKVLVLAEGEEAANAKLLGDGIIVGGTELIKQIEEGTLEFDHCLSTLDFLPNIKHLPRILKNKMPNTRRGTATDDIVAALQVFLHGESYIADNSGVLRHTVALTTFKPEEIKDNIKVFLKTIESHKLTSKAATTDYSGERSFSTLKKVKNYNKSNRGPETSWLILL